MFRKLALLGLVSAAWIAFAGSPATAAPISLNNPYRSFNLTGVNYGSVQWQRNHPQSRTSAARIGGWRVFGRR